MKPPSRAELIDYLVTTGIAGQVATPRQNNLKHYRRLVEGDPYHQFGLTFQRKWTFSDVLALMAQRCGVVADEDYVQGRALPGVERCARRPRVHGGHGRGRLLV